MIIFLTKTQFCQKKDKFELQLTDERCVGFITFSIPRLSILQPLYHSFIQKLDFSSINSQYVPQQIQHVDIASYILLVNLSPRITFLQREKNF
jgi:hypothetical protein